VNEPKFRSGVVQTSWISTTRRDSRPLSVGRVPTYLVESYLPKLEPGAAVIVAALARGESGARHRWSLFLPEDEICFHVLDGDSEEVIREATVRAELRCQRISEVDLISAEPLEPEKTPERSPR
jgi:hypothetical protein